MKKRIAAVLCLILIAVSLCSCHKPRTRSDFDLPTTFDTSRTCEITFWAKNDTNKSQTRIYEKAVTDFEKLYPNVKVNLRLYTNYGDIYNDVITNISTDTTPNVCITYPDHIATYLEGENVVVDLDPLISDSLYGLGGSELRFDGPKQNEIVPQFLEECKINGITYALPYMRSTEACYVNRTYVEALGYELPDVLTWEFVWEVSEAAAKKDENGVYLINGQKTMIPFIYKSTDNMMIQMLRQKDAGYSTDSGEILLFNDTTRELLLNIALHVKNGAFSTFKISSYPANFLNAGQCIFAVDSTAGATWMGSNAPLLDISPDKLVEFETAVRPVPQFDPEHPQMISQGPSVCIFNKEDSNEVLASWLFAQYLLSNDVQIAYAQTEGYVPVTTKAQDSEAYQTYLSLAGTDNAEHYYVKMDASRLLLEHPEYTFVTPVFNGSASLRDASGQLIEEVTKGVRRKKTVDDSFISQLYSDMTSLYRLDQIRQTAPSEADDAENEAQDPTKEDLGPLPPVSLALLIALPTVWIILGAILLRRAIRARKVKKL